MADATARAELYSRLSEVIGVDNAGTLMSYLPGDEPATRSDISVLDGRMDRFEQRMDRFEDRLQALEDKIDRRMDSFHSALLYQGRTFAMASVASIVTTAALVAGIVRIL